MIQRARHGRQMGLYHLLELALGAGAFLAAYWLRHRVVADWFPGGANTLDQVLWLLPAFLVIWGLLAWMWGSYREFRGRDAVSHASNALITDVVSMLGIFSLLTVFKQHQVNRSFLGIFVVLHFVTIVGLRLAVRGILLHWTARGYDRHFVLIGGTGEEARALARALDASTAHVVQVWGFLTEDATELGRSIDGRPVLGLLNDVQRIAKADVIDAVYLVPRKTPLEDLRKVILDCDAVGIVVHLNLPLFSEINARIETHGVGDRPFLTLTSVPKGGFQLAVKRVLDVAGAVAILALLSPILLLVALLVRMTSRGPVIFSQTRMGMNGRPFMLYKFRTMVADAHKQRHGLEAKNELDGPAFKITNDPRITWIGRILRKTSLDEFPQLINVIKGDMSLVGPRPLPDYEVEKIQPWQRRRMNMRPGITCLWAVQGRSSLKFEDWMRLDLEYIDRWSLWLDVKILARTIPTVLGGKGAY